MKGYKAFGKGMICRGKQYAENTTFEEDEAVICEKGMHFCKDPLAVLDYYPLVDINGDMAEFAEVEALDEPETDDEQKYCTKKLKIGAKLSFAELVKASISLEKCTGEKVIGSSGYRAQIGSSGDFAQIGSSGDFAQIGSSGYRAQIGSSGKNTVICCAGHGCKAKGKIGSWITLSEWDYDSDGDCAPICVRSERIDGVRIKEDTFYMLKNGEFTEVENEDNQ